MVRSLLVVLVCLVAPGSVYAATCTYNSITAKLPATINFSTGTEAGQIISSAWQETITPIALDCTGPAVNAEVVESIIRSVAVDSGKSVMLDGKRYIIYKTDDPKIGVISEVADSTNYVPLTTDFQVLYSRTMLAGSKATFGSRIRIRLVVLGYLPPGPHSFPGAARLTWHGMRL